MLIHDRFVFIHMPKTGGTFVSSELKGEMPPGSLERGKKHQAWADIPDEARGRPALMYVRSPWDWYVSWYHDVKAKMLARGASVVAGVNDFETTIRKACSGRLVGPSVLPSGEPFADSYTARLLQMCGDGWESGDLVFGRFESLIDDLDRFLAAVGAPLEDGAVERMRNAEPLNGSDHAPYTEYYNAELRDLVAESCRIPIERFGYRF